MPHPLNYPRPPFCVFLTRPTNYPTGNVAPAGKGLDSTYRTICTWLSRDGGVTWQDVAPDAYLYVTISGTGLLVMALHPNETPATEIRVSTDVGQCW